jgi:hypothetical protein
LQFFQRYAFDESRVKLTDLRRRSERNNRDCEKP